MAVLDVGAVIAGRQTLASLAEGATPDDARETTTAIYEALAKAIAGANDDEVTYVPRDPTPDDSEASGWTIAAVVCHLTAGFEEAASLALTIARGVVPTGRSRFEVDPATLPSAAAVAGRLAESRRMVEAMLAAWPDEPHLELRWELVPRIGPLNAVGFQLLGAMHASGHLDQVREVLRQARAQTLMTADRAPSRL